MNDLSHPLGKQAPRQSPEDIRPALDAPGASRVGTPTRKIQDAARHPRLARELRTIRAMVDLYCRDHHAPNGDQCRECMALVDYATRRLDRCVFGDDKPTCANCKVHCYNVPMRERVREVMRYAGPRMIWRHPVLALLHLRDGRRPALDLPEGMQHAPDGKTQQTSTRDGGGGRRPAEPSGVAST
jgi:hypothetical protein